MTEINRPKTNWLDNVADVKRVGDGEKAQFKIRQEGIRAFVQAKGATTARSKVSSKAVTLDTLAVSARPMINIVELKNGQAQMSDLIADAAYQMEMAEYHYIQNVLDTAAATWASPYYATGSGIVKATFDPMVRYWMRASAGASPVILGDIDMVSKLGELTGFTVATTTKQYADQIMVDQNTAGFIGTYIGAKVINLVNPLVEGSGDFAFNRDKLYIIPGNADTSMRPLKVVFEGDVNSVEDTDIDDLSYEVRLDQFFNAGILYGDRPYVSVYDDSSI